MKGAVLIVGVLSLASNLRAQSDIAHINQIRGQELSAQAPLPTLPPTPGPRTEWIDDKKGLSCTYQRIVKQQPFKLANIRALATPGIWPGEMIQGRAFQNGDIVPVTIPRKGGRLLIKGANLSGADAAEYAIDLPEISQAAAHEAIENLLSQKALSVESELNLRPEPVFNDSHMAWVLGLDQRFTKTLNQHIHVDPASNKHYVLVNFRQTYYQVSFPPPEDSYAFFKDEINFKDPQNQIGPGNIPLYIANVGYGRHFYFLFSSSYPESAIVSALNAADVHSGGVTIGNEFVYHNQILQQTTVNYFVDGGGPATGIANSGTMNGFEAFDFIKKQASNFKMEHVNDFKGAVPVSYSVNYVTTRGGAIMGFAAAWDMKECQEQTNSGPSFWFKLTGVDDKATVELIGPNDARVNIYANTNIVPFETNINERIPKEWLGGPVTLRVTLYNEANESGIRFQFGRQSYGPNGSIAALNDKLGTMTPATTREAAPWVEMGKFNSIKDELGGWHGNRIDYRIQFNPKTGDVVRLQRWDGNNEATY